MKGNRKQSMRAGYLGYDSMRRKADKMMGGGHAKGVVQKKDLGGLVSAALPLLGNVASRWLGSATPGRRKHGGKVK